MAEFVFREHPVPDTLKSWFDDWLVTQERTAVCLLAFGQPYVGMVSIEPAAWLQLAAMLREAGRRFDGVDLVLRCRGGNLAYVRDPIEVLIEDLQGRSSAVVMDFAHSAGSILAAATGTVVLTEGAYLGTPTPQISADPTQFPAASAAVAHVLMDHSSLEARELADAAALTSALQWESEVARWVETIARVNGWPETPHDRFKQVLLSKSIPHDAHLFKSDFVGCAPIVQAGNAATEVLVNELRTILRPSEYRSVLESDMPVCALVSATEYLIGAYRMDTYEGAVT